MQTDAVSMVFKTPHGLQGIIEIFGSLDDPHFEQKNIILFDLPYPLFYGTTKILHARAHHHAAPVFVAVFQELLASGLASTVQHYSGIYAKRNIRGASHPSTHSWGIAIDLEAELYQLGSTKRFPAPVVEVFTKHGFVYGGDFQGRKDPMHFQLASGY
jgi:hypothetical protein